jgi:hypothetical protein
MVKMTDRIDRQIGDLNLSQELGPIILVFADWKYREVLENWIEGINRLQLKNFVVVSLDKHMHVFLIEKGIRTVFLEHKGDLSALWNMRITVFKYFVNCGVDFIHSDADAVWLKNPVRDYFFNDTYRPLDILISQGTIWPENVHRLWGFVLCCGFFMMRSTKFTRSLLNKLDMHVRMTGDDQISLNYIVAEQNMNWQYTSSFHLPMGNYILLCSDEVITGKGDEISIGVLPFKKFPRLYIANTDPYVSHILTPKENDAKREALKKAGTWFLRRRMK